MLKITFMGAGSTVFARNVLGDVMCTPALRECEIALYDIDGQRLDGLHGEKTIVGGIQLHRGMVPAQQRQTGEGGRDEGCHRKNLLLVG